MTAASKSSKELAYTLVGRAFLIAMMPIGLFWSVVAGICTGLIDWWDEFKDMWRLA